MNVTQRPWLNIYPSGIPANINPDEHRSVVDFMKKRCAEYKKRPAFSMMGKELSYQEVDQLSDQFGAYLQSRGLQPGDKIALMMPNLLQYPVALFGALKAGLIVVNTNPLYTPREMEHQFTDSGVSAIVIAENFAANLQKIIGKTKIQTVILASVGEMLGAFKGTMVNFVVRYVKSAVPKFDIDNTVSFSDALKQGKKFKLKGIERHPEDVIVHQYTGGTTGISKGAMLTNRNLIANLLQTRCFIEPYMDGDVNHVVLDPLPLYHIYAFTINCLCMMDVGALSVLIVNPRDISTIVKEFERYEVTGLTGVNTLFNALLNDEGFRNANLKHVQFASAGGTALQMAVAERFESLVGIQISEGYGMTEASPVVTTNPKGLTIIGTVGIPLPSTDVRIVDEDRNVQPFGERGEIQVKGPQVMKGYYNRPDETAKTITEDGWLNTGDVGIMDEKGYLKIVDRVKDMILVSGFNVFPNEIEDVICGHDKVLECAAIGVPSEKSGEMVKVCVVKKDQSLNKDELIKYCRENLTGYKVPKVVEFMDELPKSTVGKILRRKLK